MNSVSLTNFNLRQGIVIRISKKGAENKNLLNEFTFFIFFLFLMTIDFFLIYCFR